MCRSGCASLGPNKAAQCQYAAASVQNFGLFDATGGLKFRYICEYEADNDEDGVPDFLDWCKSTPVGVAVDRNGCSKTDMDLDRDRRCAQVTDMIKPDETAPIFAPAVSRWCPRVGNLNLLDNCPFIANGGTQQADVTDPADLDLTDPTCSPGTPVFTLVHCLALVTLTHFVLLL